MILAHCIFSICVVLITFLIPINGEYCYKDTCKPQRRYLLYDINPPEGFNLRRDVYIRYAVFVASLVRSRQHSLQNFHLVLPPWTNLYHWKSSDTIIQLPWSLFFDLPSLRLFVPVIEMYQLFEEIGIHFGKINIDEVYVLQHYPLMFESGKFEDKMEIQPCINEINTNFYYYNNLTSTNISCLSFHGFASHLSKILESSQAETIMFDHAEIALHDHFGSPEYWKCRRSMRFNKELVEIASFFRKTYLNSSNLVDKTELPDDWRQETARRTAVGGPYLAVHLRRRDFVWSRPKQVPSLQNAASQVSKKLKELNLDAVFVATDCSNTEYEEFKSILTPNGVKVHKFKPNKEIKKHFRDGGVAIIEQIICSYARYFIGTFESTFSFRIQEEREIIGFPVETTFNRFCGDKEQNCGPTSQWKIVY